MNATEKNAVKSPWGQPVYARFREEIDPFGDQRFFRPLNRAYTGDNTFWSTPSPEPDLDDEFWETVEAHLDDERIKMAARRLARAITGWEPDGGKLVFVSILRAGVPIADWLCRLIPGAVTVSVSLFVGLGIDRIALNMLREDYPDRKIVFVDGWTGRGGVARAIAGLEAGPLAVLIDPWGWAGFSGCREDIFCPTACFTGAATLGFSRTFFEDENSLFGAYRFPRKYCRTDLIRAWQSLCPDDRTADAGAPDGPERFFRETDLRLHSNEVCRALINADPETLFFLDSEADAEERFPLLLKLARRRGVGAEYNRKDLAQLRTRVACSLNIA
ncbi:hypothetical protein DENIS_2850 [Desulfonema ishimotonii]|uniref:Cysteine protease StiP N-terminal domain-containing protein n=1 Tax=Desulfonema ishimotonii TaxID=45657 RepID=A0A401FY36_9BACT|nr:cysteine protease StiP domain-containing protein [Desulfonema ishimotonii]GBC61888.1 hypothetical protein DENIS_2850 [Desulfonema ishimotonii]